MWYQVEKKNFIISKKIMNKKICNFNLLFVFLITVISVSSCGYGFRGSGSILPADVKRVYIPAVENNSSESGLTQTLTEALRDEFERYGALYVVDDLSEADAVLLAKITEVKRETRTSTATDNTALQYDTHLRLSADLSKTNGQKLWSSNKIAVSSSFATSSNVVVTSSADFASSNLNSGDLGNLNNRELARGQERDVLDQLAEKSAREIYTQAVMPEF